ncbi:MAG: STAS-like domain-containing protein [Odoribacter sp.]|nr:STAS-like domain-containing protein [Odoribacter sp.]
MKTIVVKKFGSIISDKETGNALLEELKQGLKENDEIILDLEGVISMATFCSKQVFGSLYLELGADSFFYKIKFKNATNDVLAIIKIGIQSALEEFEKK